MNLHKQNVGRELVFRAESGVESRRDCLLYFRAGKAFTCRRQLRHVERSPRLVRIHLNQVESNLQRLTHNAGVTRKMRPPERVAENDIRNASPCSLFFRTEKTPVEGLHAEHIEVICSHVGNIDPFRRGSAGQRNPIVVIPDDSLEAVILVPQIAVIKI